MEGHTTSDLSTGQHPIAGNAIPENTIPENTIP